MDNSFMPVVIEDLSKIYYPHNVALDNISLRIYEGDTVAVLGNNGSGKSTLLRILATLTHRSSGFLEIFGFDPLRDSTKIKRKIGFMPERFSFYPTFTVDEIITFFEKLNPTLTNNKTDTEYHRENMIKLLNISSFLDAKISTLSKGMLHKVGLAVTLIHNPPFLILDEPTSGLDPLVRNQVRRILANLSKEYDKTILISSHILEDIEALSDSVFILEEGKVIQDVTWIKSLIERFQKFERIEIYSEKAELIEKEFNKQFLSDLILFHSSFFNGFEVYCRKRDFVNIKSYLIGFDEDIEIRRYNFSLESMYILNHANVELLEYDD